MLQAFRPGGVGEEKTEDEWIHILFNVIFCVCLHYFAFVVVSVRTFLGKIRKR